MSRLVFVCLFLVLLGSFTSSVSAFKSKRSALMDQITQQKPNRASDLSMCVCAYGCVNGDAPVNDTFFVHCRTSDKGACSHDVECEKLCLSCCNLYGVPKLAGNGTCAENLGQCLIGVPGKCSAI
jgi:hypothetical protein